MIIPISAHPQGDGGVGDDCGGPPEWSLLELNGEILLPADGGPPLTTPASAESADDVRLELGSVRFAKDGIPVMTVGSHQIRGKIVQLQQPFVVMKKRKRAGNVDDLAAPAGTHKAKADSGGIQYDILGVIKKKVLFSEYPNNIMR